MFYPLKLAVPTGAVSRHITSHSKLGILSHRLLMVARSSQIIFAQTVSLRVMKVLPTCNEVLHSPDLLSLIPRRPDEYSFSCSTGQGAILSLPVSAQREDIVAKDKFGKYMLKHLEEWFTFAREHVGIVRREDIVLVTGRDLAKSWANIVFQEGDGDVTFEVRVTGNSQIEWKFTLRGAGGVAHAVGPSGNLKVYS